MQKLGALTAAAALAVVLGFGGTAQADEFADAVESFTPPTGCKTTTAAGNGNDCDISGDDGDNGTDALGTDDGAAGDNTTFTSLGFTTDFDNNGGNGLQPLVHRHRRMIHPIRLQEFENICKFPILVNAPNESVH